MLNIADPGNPYEAGFIAMPQDTRPGEGMQVLPVATSMFDCDMLVMNAEPCGKNYKGGFMLYDVTDPLNPSKLSEGFGDRTRSDAHQTHSAFVWQHGERGYLVATDNVEFPDVDIYDISNPRRPRMLTEPNLNDYDVDQPELGLTDSFLHDMVVKCIDNGVHAGTCVMIASYWDGGYVLLDVTNPAKPVFVGDTEYAAIDPQLREQTNAELTPAGNGHRAEFTADNRFFIGTDEDFAPYRADDFKITTGQHQGTYPSGIVPGGAAPAILDDLTLNGPVATAATAAPTPRRSRHRRACRDTSTHSSRARRRRSFSSEGRWVTQVPRGPLLPRREGTRGRAGRVGRGALRQPPQR